MVHTFAVEVAQRTDIPDAPRSPDSQAFADSGFLGHTLLVEEVDELYEALIDKNLVAVADALGDIGYILYGIARDLGIPLDDVVELIHAANMRKRGGPVRADGKLLKPSGWVGPELEIEALLAATGPAQRD